MTIKSSCALQQSTQTTLSVEEPQPSHTLISICTAGICVPRNPSGFGCWAWVAQHDGKIISQDWGCQGDGDGTTNNTAAYEAAVHALEWVSCRRFRLRAKGFAVHLKSDSRLVINQINGIWDCRTNTLRIYLRHAGILLEQINQYVPVTLSWISHAENGQADVLAQRAYAEARRASAATQRKAVLR